MSKKLIVIINGHATVGKDYLINNLDALVLNKSSVDLIKREAKNLGWNGEKDERGRKFLAELKRITEEYSDFLDQDFLNSCKEFLKDDNVFMFYHVREPGTIDRLVNLLHVNGIHNVVTLLVQRDTGLDFNNFADKAVDDYVYDYVYDNNRPIEETAKAFSEFMHDLLEVNGK